MREIKFKAKRIDNDNWVYGDLVHDIAEHNAPRICIDREYSTGTTFVANAPRVNYKTIGQYTGLTDKNGKEIYEGDILKIHIPIIPNTKPFYGFVGYGRANFCLFDKYGMQRAKLDTISKEEMEVIGNIYDNKELIWND